jgi:hypothetical protein
MAATINGKSLSEMRAQLGKLQAAGKVQRDWASAEEPPQRQQRRPIRPLTLEQPKKQFVE